MERPPADVIRSWRSPISPARLGWYPTAEGIRPSNVETSEPAWVNRKMLSTNSSTSLCSTSRKYSAIVSAESATRSRTPGGSSICPNTRAVFSIAGLGHLEEQVVALAGPLPHAGEDRNAALLLGLAPDH